MALSFALRAVERIAPRRPEAMAIGGVWIYGLDQLEAAEEASESSFVERWRDAICFCVGSEEFEKFCSGTRHR